MADSPFLNALPIHSSQCTRSRYRVNVPAVSMQGMRVSPLENMLPCPKESGVLDMSVRHQAWCNRVCRPLLLHQALCMDDTIRTATFRCALFVAMLMSVPWVWSQIRFDGKCGPRTGATDTTRPLASYRQSRLLQSLSSDVGLGPRLDRSVASLD